MKNPEIQNLSKVVNGGLGWSPQPPKERGLGAEPSFQNFSKIKHY